MAATNQGFATGADRQAEELRRRAGVPLQDGAVLQQQPNIDDRKKQPVIDEKSKQQVSRTLFQVDFQRRPS
jgi:hypothetical protein